MKKERGYKKRWKIYKHQENDDRQKYSRFAQKVQRSFSNHSNFQLNFRQHIGSTSSLGKWGLIKSELVEPNLSNSNSSNEQTRHMNELIEQTDYANELVEPNLTWLCGRGPNLRAPQDYVSLG